MLIHCAPHSCSVCLPCRIRAANGTGPAGSALDGVSLRAQYADEMKYYINIANSCGRLAKAAMSQLISAGGTAKGKATTRARMLFYVRVGERAQSLAHVRASGWGRSDPGAMPLCAASLRACQASARARRSAAERQFARARCDR